MQFDIQTKALIEKDTIIEQLTQQLAEYIDREKIMWESEQQKRIDHAAETNPPAEEHRRIDRIASEQTAFGRSQRRGRFSDVGGMYSTRPVVGIAGRNNSTPTAAVNETPRAIRARDRQALARAGQRQ